jgi:fatty-acyl-CoA synthase
VTAIADLNAKFARQAWLRALERTAAIDRELNVTLPVLIDRLAERHDGAPALVGREQSLSFRELAGRARRYARWGIALGLRQGDVVGLSMSNCPEYLAVWLGLTRIGATVALLNTHLGGDALAHCIHIVAPKSVIVGADLTPAAALVRERCAPSIRWWVQGGEAAGFAPLDAALQALPPDVFDAGEAPVTSIDSTALYIYTSGTTGLPKAAKVSHYRIMQWSQWFAGLLDTQTSDRMYNCLPLYHSVGGVVAVGATLVSGGAVVIRRRFSASDFWRDVRAERATLFQYIGELCRYLVNSPGDPDETRHSLRIACGNGLRPEVWDQFRARFKIPHIVEYYASTEGSFSLYNCEGEPGAIGRIPAFLAARLPVALVRYDVDRGEPWRGADGLCARCATNESGEAIGLIPSAEQRGRRFEGYADPAASERKLLRDVFEPGDVWYRTGDLMRRDARGFYYFVDRVGETFRWKGENVSTAEVLSALAAVEGVLEGVVYGVVVPGTDGRAGMAALVVSARFDLATFRQEVHGRLPAYARPLFLRILVALEATGTFKPKKQDLVVAGFDPNRTADPLYFDDPRAGAYVRIDAPLHDAIVGGQIRV